ncbi:MAG: hypothetical protein UV02_C0015G0005 [Candidatus Kuenenbacteria bacterium GW2011_GWA2_42_15]|uniref:Uncharacterized protein n=3 Tax=Candidatus Kueneniibacteriota TaxID=1752740 RepID=A0A0G1B7V6_9BACT|nr:MAG: hypothetical protein UV02_C0015G0005 [Candidatus Kuenenbacteria bacterium GW2011_GWA2_42_15]OGG91681.1 MAG: hypothetical protein A3H55_03410 [Candidatus Kuenenbacteria bacterium RIFCSPLOWO2_02_FULL_42_16]OGG95835.1 MAG: hypothetical protein A2V95_01645 [Candidatus Kuenenbacteria bacterium RBG_16_41_7]
MGEVLSPNPNEMGKGELTPDEERVKKIVREKFDRIKNELTNSGNFGPGKGDDGTVYEKVREEIKKEGVDPNIVDKVIASMDPFEATIYRNK